MQNEYDLNSSRGVSTFSVPHNKVADYIIGGWQVNALGQMRNNLPFSITIPGDLANVGNPNTYMRPNVVSDPKISNPNVTGWFNTAAFALPVSHTYGNAGRNIPRPDWLRRMDASMFRSVPITERMRFELRAEAHGITNTTIFNAPVSTLAAFNFGQVAGLLVLHADWSQVRLLG